MANTTQPTNHPLTPRVWAKKLFHEMIAEDYFFFGKFMGKSEDDKASMVTIRDDLTKTAGEQITYGLRSKLNGAGVSGDAIAEGEEEQISTYSDSMLINKLANQIRSEGEMTEQRMTWDFRMEAKDALKDWWAERLDISMFNQLCGNTAETNLKYTGFNATIAPDTDHIIRIDSTTTDASLSTTNVFTFSIIDRCVERAKTISPLVRPFNVNGTKKWVMFLHPYQVYDLRTQGQTAAGSFFDLHKAALQGGKFGDNPLYNGSLGEYNNVILHEALNIPTGCDSTTAAPNTRRAVFCGAQALGFARGGVGKMKDRMTWVEKEFNYDAQLGIQAKMIFGIKKSRFNSKDFGTIVVPTYAVAH